MISDKDASYPQSTGVVVYDQSAPYAPMQDNGPYAVHIQAQVTLFDPNSKDLNDNP